MTYTGLIVREDPDELISIINYQQRTIEMQKREIAALMCGVGKSLQNVPHKGPKFCLAPLPQPRMRFIDKLKYLKKVWGNLK
jgi:hypothetical protein